MNDFAGGVGSAVEAAIVGRTFEPDRGRSGSVEFAKQITCPNCGTDFAANYCPHCGQKADLHRSLKAIGHDLVHGVLHLDGKLWHTLPLLAFKPGKLTRRYIEGERARFVSPMAMFLFSVFAMFAVFQVAGIGVPSDISPVMDERTAGQIAEERAALEAEREALVQSLQGADAPGEEGAINGEIAAIDGELRTLDMVAGFAGESQASADDPAGSSGSDAQRAGISTDTGDQRSNITVNTGIDWIDEGLGEKWRKNPGLMLYKLQANAYKFSWLLIPLSIPFVWLLFLWRRGFKAYDHAVFVTYSLAFMSLLFLAISIGGLLGVGSGILVLVGTFLPPIHIYKQLRHAYSLKRFAALWRTGVLLIFIVIVTTLFLQALIMLGAL